MSHQEKLWPNYLKFAQLQVVQRICLSMLRAPRAFWHHPGHASDLTTACGLKVANLPPGALTPPSKIPTTCVKILANNSRLIAALATGSSADG